MDPRLCGSTKVSEAGGRWLEGGCTGGRNSCWAPWRKSCHARPFLVGKVSGLFKSVLSTASAGAVCVITHAAARDARAVGEVNVREGRAHRALRAYRPEAQRLMDACDEVRCRLGSGRVAQQLLAQAGGALLYVSKASPIHGPRYSATSNEPVGRGALGSPEQIWR